VAVVDILQGHRHDLCLAVDINAAEELQSETGAEILALREFEERAAGPRHQLRRAVLGIAGRVGAADRRLCATVDFSSVTMLRQISPFGGFSSDGTGQSA